MEMTTHTIEVTDIEEDLIQRLNLRAFQQGQDRSVCIRDLLRRALDEEEITEFINAQVHEARRERHEREAVVQAAHQEAA
jgi:metal-responsive CopG/Arc/MetJ family transcriptional regulator